MEAAATITSFKGWTSREHAHPRPPKTFMHSHSLHLPCRVQPPSATACFKMCKDERPIKDGWHSMEMRRRPKIECQSSLTETCSSSTTTTTTTTTTQYNNTHDDPPTLAFTQRPGHDEVGVQELTVYEVNERDRGSPVLLPSSKLATDWYKRFNSLGGLGDLVPFSNKIFDGSLKKRLGITAGIISVIQYYPKENGFLFEAVYSFYFGDFGHISVKGPYKSHEDTILTVTGGSGIFNGVYGTVQISNVEFPLVLFYKFKLYGIPQLPQELRWKTIPPTKGLRPSQNASLPGVALPNFTD